jgi:4a-hydroxytetrahydrobiopterin dehydratase
MSTKNLRDKKCIPCEGGVPALSKQAVGDFIGHIDKHWKVREEHSRLFMSVKTKDFAHSMLIAQRIGKMADDQWHHPVLTIGFGQLDIEVWTHKINGLVESDFIFASKVDQILGEDSSVIFQ